MTFIVSAGVKYGVLQGQIFKLKELYHVAPQMKGLDEHFSNQLKYRRYDVIWWRNNVKSFSKRNKTHLFPPAFMYARMRGCESMHGRTENLSQCIPECAEGFCKILLALWATWFISFLQDMLLGMFVYYLAKASFLQDMLLCLYVCFGFFLYVIIFP
jgi:hypothetical protein